MSTAKPLHIALVSAYPPSRGSLNEYGYHFANALRARPDVARLSIIADTLDAPQNELADTGEIRRVWSFNSSLSALHIKRTLADLKPDAVIFNLQFASFGDRRVPAALGLFAPWLARQKNCVSLTLLHNLFETVDLLDTGFAKTLLEEKALRWAGDTFTRVLLKSHAVAVTMPRYQQILESKYGATNIFHAPHGAFEAPGDIAPLPEAPTVMAFGKFGTYKKVELLLDAHRELLKRDERVRLVIAGSDSPNAKGYLADVAKRYADLPNVTYTGYVAEEDVPRIFGDATVVAFPYESTTGSSGVLHQAGQFGRAAVMPKIGDLADLVKDEGFHANFFTPGNVESLMAALLPVLFNRERADLLGRVNHAASSVTLNEVSDLYMSTIREVQARWTLKPRARPHDLPTT